MQEKQGILAWFDVHKRDLPWRRSSDPYRIWVSEIMLQQTRVDTVVPYYEKFVAKYPTIGSLAAAELDEVLADWSGLGYYRRARFLHAAAVQVAAAGGAMPETIAALKELPGIGEYTAAAIGSIAFGCVEPVLDGNVERVLARFVGMRDDVKRAAARRRLREVAAELVDPDRPGDSNQALMELGATVCTPRRPRCGSCPLAERCRARAAGDPEAVPPARRRRSRERLERTVFVATRAGRVLLVRRPDDHDLLAGTWELPWAEGHDLGDRDRFAAELAARYGGRWTIGAVRARVRHSVTYRDLAIEVRAAAVESDGTAAEGVRAGWFDEGELPGLALSSLVGKALAGATVVPGGA